MNSFEQCNSMFLGSERRIVSCAEHSDNKAGLRAR